MASALFIERWAWWRPLGVSLILAFVSVPAVPLLWRAGAAASLADALTVAFRSSLANSAQVAVLAGTVALFAGLPLGVLSSLYTFRFRALLLALQALPLLLPSHLLAIGWSSIGIRLGFSESLSGVPGCVLVFSAIGVPIVTLSALASCTSLSESQVEAARLSGGERTVIAQTLRYAFYPALVAATLSGILSLSDPGPGQIFGLPVAGGEILTSFAAFFDFARAGQQCMILSGITLCIIAPALFVAAAPLANELLVRQTRPVRPMRQSAPSKIAALLMAALILGQLVFPLLGLTLPAFSGGQFDRAWNEVLRTAQDTSLYAMGAGIMATVLGFLLAFCAARSDGLRRAGLVGSLALLALPPSLAALGVIALAGGAPEWTDPILRSRFTVSLTLGMRFFPVSALVALRAWASMPATWAMVSGVHGIPFWKYLWKVLLPFFAPSLLMSFLAAALLSASDIVTTLLLHPPGASSLPLSIFTIMANAPESLVAALCLVYVASAALVLASLWWLAGRTWK